MFDVSFRRRLGFSCVWALKGVEELIMTKLMDARIEALGFNGAAIN